jgi:glutamine cyclotransferase
MKKHPEFKGYLVAEDGKVFSCHKKRSNGKNNIESYIDYDNPKELQLKKHPTNGYVYVRSKRLHRLVAELYIPNPNNLPEVNHIDKNKENNSVTNLEWVDRQKNAEYSLSKLYIIENIKTGEIFEVFNLSKFSRENNLHNGCLHDTLNGRLGRKQHKGYRILKREG